VSRERHESQANRFQRMLDPGALHTHDGRTTTVGRARPPQRAREPLDHAVQAAPPRLGTQAEARKVPQDQGAASVSQGHGQRLEQRPRAVVSVAQEGQDAQDTPDQLVAPAPAWGPPRPRAERDVRPQTIRTVRPRRLANALTAFMAGLVGTRTMQVRLDGLVHILLERRGARRVTGSQRISGIPTTGLSAAYQRLLTAVVDGLCAMDWRAPGKPMPVRLTGRSP
jgi:hypothetical protein